MWLLTSCTKSGAILLSEVNVNIAEYRKLCVAVLVMAFEDLVKSNSDSEDALQWVYSNKDGYLFDFIVICRVLEIDPKGIRNAIKTNKIKDLLEKYKSMKISPKVAQIKPAKRRAYADRGRRVASGR